MKTNIEINIIFDKFYNLLIYNYNVIYLLNINNIKSQINLYNRFYTC